MLKQRVKNATDLQVQKAPVRARAAQRRPLKLIENSGPEIYNDADNFLGIGKKARARKQVRFDNRQARKMMKAESRQYKKAKKADALALRTSGNAQAKIIEAQSNAAVAPILAAQGIQQQPQESTLNTALNAAGGLFSNQPMQAGNGDVYGNQPFQQQYAEEEYIEDEQPTEKKKSNTTLYLIIAGVVAVAAFLYFKKK